MEYLYIDESGSLTSEFAFVHPNFVMCVVRVKDITNLRKLLKRFIYENYQEIKGEKILFSDYSVVENYFKYKIKSELH